MDERETSHWLLEWSNGEDDLLGERGEVFIPLNFHKNGRLGRTQRLLP